MAKTLRQRQADWRSRRDLKSTMFDVLNEQRVNALLQTWKEDNRPEARAIRDFFIAYPRCFRWPVFSLENGMWWIVPDPRGDFLEDAAIFVALSEVTSIPVKCCGERGPFYPKAIEQVKQEVAELRRLNLWGVQQ